MNYLLAAAGFVIIALCSTCFVLNNKNEVLQAKLNEATVNYELAKNHIREQNDAIARANEKLTGYETQIAKLHRDYNKRLNSYKKQIDSIVTCDEGMEYFKHFLEDIK